MQRSRGTRTKTRNVLKKKVRARGLSPITKGLQTFEAIGPRGSAYEVSVKDGNKTKIVVARPEHLVKNVN